MNEPEAMEPTAMLADVDSLFSQVADKSPAERLTFFHNVSTEAAKIAVGAAVTAGIELKRVMAEHPRGTFNGWLECNVNFSRRTAFKYMALADALLGDGYDYRAVEVADEPKLIGEVADKIDGRSLSELYQELGVVRKSSTCGGARPGAGRPPANPNPADDAVKSWTLALGFIRTRIPALSYKFLPLREAEGALLEVEAVRDKLKARIDELKHAGIA